MRSISALEWSVLPGQFLAWPSHVLSAVYVPEWFVLPELFLLGMVSMERLLLQVSTVPQFYLQALPRELESHG